MDVAGATLLKRLIMVIDEGTITRVFYPVLSPDRSAADVIAWLASAPDRATSGGV